VLTALLGPGIAIIGNADLAPSPWVYLHFLHVAQADQERVVGSDLMLGTQLLPSVGQRHLLQANAVYVNLECPFVDCGAVTCKYRSQTCVPSISIAIE